MAALLTSVVVTPLLGGHLGAGPARCLAHGFFFLGATLWLGYWLGSRPAPAKRRPAAAAAAGVACIALAQQAQQISMGAAVLLLGALLLAALIRPLAGAQISACAARHPIPAAVLCALAVSWSWELVHQPLFEVYGAKARGQVQWNQVLSDLAGIGTGAALAWALARRGCNCRSRHEIGRRKKAG